MGKIAKGMPWIRLNIPTAPAIKLLEANPNRAGLRIDCLTGTGVTVSFDDPAVTYSGDKGGEQILVNESYIENNPQFVNTGAVYIVSSAGTEDIRVREDTAVD